MKKEFKNKYISTGSIRKINKIQKQMQLKEFEKKGKRAKRIHFYEALEFALRGFRI